MPYQRRDNGPVGAINFADFDLDTEAGARGALQLELGYQEYMKSLMSLQEDKDIAVRLANMPDSEESLLYINAYNDELNRLVLALALTGNLDAALAGIFNLYGHYQGGVKYLKNLLKERGERAYLQMYARASNPNMMFDRDINSLGMDYIAANPNDWYQYKSINLDDTLKQAEAIGKAFASKIKTKIIGHDNAGSLLKTLTSLGYTPDLAWDAVMTALDASGLINNDEDLNLLRTLLSNLREEALAMGQWDDNQRGFIDSRIKRGAWEGLVGGTKEDYMGNPTYSRESSSSSSSKSSDEYIAILPTENNGISNGDGFAVPKIDFMPNASVDNRITIVKNANGKDKAYIQYIPEEIIKGGRSSVHNIEIESDPTKTTYVTVAPDEANEIIKNLYASQYGISPDRLPDNIGQLYDVKRVRTSAKNMPLRDGNGGVRHNDDGTTQYGSGVHIGYVITLKKKNK